MIKLKVSKVVEPTLQELASQGFAVARETELDFPSLPPDITELDDEELMLLFTKLTSYLDFVSTQVALAQLEERELQRTMEVLEARVMASHSAGRGDKVAVIKAAAAADQNVIDATEAYAEAYNYRKLIEVMQSNVERDSQLVSRELTRRTAGDTFKTRSRKFLT